MSRAPKKAPSHAMVTKKATLQTTQRLLGRDIGHGLIGILKVREATSGVALMVAVGEEIVATRIALLVAFARNLCRNGGIPRKQEGKLWESS